MKRLEGKVAIVTGSTSGLGKAMAILFAEEGAKVVVNSHLPEDAGRETLDAIRKAGGEAIYVQADVTKIRECENLVRQAKDKFGKLNVLINNAGIEIRGGVETLTEEDWDTMLNVDLKGIFLVSKYAVPAMREAGGGSIVNVASVLSFSVIPERSAYCAAKGGVLQLSRTIALDYAKDGIRCNNLVPGAFHTPLLEQSMQDSGAYDTVMGILKGNSVFGRMGDPRELANCALFLASDESSFVTGSTLNCDGGWFLG